MSLGDGSIYSASCKQKMMSRSSTESEVIGVYDMLPQILWTKNFHAEQGQVVESLLHQDNISAMLLEKNGRLSSSKRTKHMHISFFYVVDWVASKDISIQHCPTTKMLADYFTKPLQGCLFLRMRDAIMNLDPCSPYHSGHRSVLEKDNINEKTDTSTGSATSTSGSGNHMSTNSCGAGAGTSKLGVASPPTIANIGVAGNECDNWQCA
jgi:hypothetical protein